MLQAKKLVCFSRPKFRPVTKKRQLNNNLYDLYSKLYNHQRKIIQLQGEINIITNQNIISNKYHIINYLCNILFFLVICGLISPSIFIIWAQYKKTFGGAKN